MFTVYGKDEITVLAKQFLPHEPEDKVQSEWKDFKYELLGMRKKFLSLKKQIAENKLKFKKTSSEWLIGHVLNSSQSDEYPLITHLIKIAAIVPVTNAWPERGASAVKRIKDRMRSTLKNDMLNGLLHISMNGPPANSKEADALINRVVERYVEERHYKAPTIHSVVTSSISTMTQTDITVRTVDVPETEIADTADANEVDDEEDELMIPCDKKIT